MGRERKRGKLEEFNRLLRGATDTTYSVQHGDLSILPSVRYVITLDSDTQLPMEAARRLVGTLSHPLNRPRFDEHERRVTEGYGVLQPRISVSVVSAGRTFFAQIFSGHVGVDPYTTAVSDRLPGHVRRGQLRRQGHLRRRRVRALRSPAASRRTRFSATICSRASTPAPGWCTDIDLVDDYPAGYLTYAARQHRWVRGDWQIARWLWRTVPDASRRRGAERAAGHLALEDPRQPAPQPDAAVAAAAPRRGLDDPAGLGRAVDDGWRCWCWRSRPTSRSARSLGSHVARRPAARSSRGRARQHPDEPAPGGVLDRSCWRTRASLMLDAIGRALIAHADHPPAAARVGDSRPRRAPQRVDVDGLSDDVAGAGRGGGADAPHPRPGAGATAARQPDPDRCGRSRRRSSTSPRSRCRTARRRRSGTERAAFRAVARRDLAVLRGSGRSRRQLADSRQLPGEPRRRHRAPDLADQHRPAAAVDARRLRLRLRQLRRRRSTASSRPSTRCCGCSAIAATSTTGTTRRRCRRCRRPTSRRSTAAIWPATCSRCAPASSSSPSSAPIIDACVLEGIDDDLALFEEAIDSVARGKTTGGAQEGAGQPAHAPGAAAGDARSNGTGCSTQLEERLQATSVLLHELEEPLLTAASGEVPTTAWTDAAMWLERAAATVTNRQHELERLTGWITRLQSAGIRAIPAGRAEPGGTGADLQRRPERRR